MAYIEVPYLNSEFLFNYNPLLVDKYHTAPFMSIAWQQALKYYEKFNKFADYLQPQYFALKELKDRVTIQIAVPDDGFNGAFLYFERCNGTRIPGPLYPDVRIIPGDVNAQGQQMRRITWSFFIDDYVTTPGHYCWYLRVNYLDGSFEELAGLPMDIQHKHENTVLIEYTHRTNDFDVWFEGIVFSYRINANNTYFQDKLERLTFRNQKANLRLLYARNWAIWNFEIGFPGEGINSWDQKKIYNIFKCDETYIDGVRFLMEEEAEFDLVDYGNRYPLKKMKVQLVEYNQSDSLTVGSAGTITVMRLGVDGYPFLIDGLSLFGAGSPGDPFPNFMASHAATNFQVEILNSAEEDAFFAQLEADRSGPFRMSGAFIRSGGILYYRRGEGENYVVATASKMTTCHEIYYETTPGATSIGLQVFQTGKTSVTVRVDAGNVPYLPPDQYVGYFVTTYNIPGPAYNGYRMRIYCNNLMTTLNVTGAGTNVKSLAGKVSPILNRYSLTNADLGVQGIGFLLNAKLELQYLFLENAGITEVNNADFSPTGDAGRWRKLKYIYLRNNKLTAVKQDKFYVDYYRIGSVYSSSAPPPGTLDTRFQTPASAPTGTSSAYRSLYAVWGFTIAY